MIIFPRNVPFEEAATHFLKKEAFVSLSRVIRFMCIKLDSISHSQIYNIVSHFVNQF